MWSNLLGSLPSEDRQVQRQMVKMVEYAQVQYEEPKIDTLGRCWRNRAPLPGHPLECVFPFGLNSHTLVLDTHVSTLDRHERLIRASLDAYLGTCAPAEDGEMVTFLCQAA